MNRKHEIRLGMIGVGMIGAEHMRGIEVVPRCKVAAIADRDADRLRFIASEFSLDRCYDNAQTLLEQDDIDGVVICTPPENHEALVLEAIAQGKHVLCEKPLALNPAGAQRIARRSKRAGLLVGSCSGRFRFSPTVVKAKEMIDSGELGEIYHVRVSGVSRRNRPGIDYHAPAKWNLDKSKSGGGALMDWGIYDLNILHYLLPNVDIKRVDGFCYRGVDEPDVGDHVFDVEEHGGAQMRSQDGLVVTWERAWAAHMNRRPCLRIYGSRAGLAFNPFVWSKDVYFEIYEDRGGKPVTISPDTDFSGWNVHISLALDFVNAIQKKRPPMTTPDDEAQVLKIIDAVYRSQQKDASVGV